MILKLHSNRGYLLVFAFITSLTLSHLAVSLLSGVVPQSIGYIFGVYNSPLNDSYGGWSLSYLLRNYVLRYAIFAGLLFVYLFDRFNLGKWLTKLSFKWVLFGLTGLWIATILLGNGRIEVTHNTVLLTQVIFPEGGGFYIYAAILWTLLVSTSYYFLSRKMPKHHALWLTLLIFLSVQEVWEYAPYLWGNIFYGVACNVTAPQVTTHIWRATPTFLLPFYAHKFGFYFNKQFTFSLCLSIAYSLILVLIPSLYFIGPFLRITWAFTYVLFARNFCGGKVFG